MSGTERDFKDTKMSKNGFDSCFLVHIIANLVEKPEII